MKYSKPEIVIKKSKSSDIFGNEDMNGEFGKDVVTIGIKRYAITGRTKKDCKKRGGEIKRVYGRDKDNNDEEILTISDVCEFEKNGKKVLEKIENGVDGSYIIIPKSEIDEVIKQLQELKK